MKRRETLAIRTIWGAAAALVVIDAALLTAGPPPGAMGYAAAITRAAIIVCAAAAVVWYVRRAGRALAREERGRRHARAEADKLQIYRATLQVLARSLDVPLAFHELATRISPLVPCDRIGLALLRESEEEFQTYTARVHEPAPEGPKPDLVFRADGTAIGRVVRSRVAMILDDAEAAAAEFLDVNVLHTSGFGSAAIVPLVIEGRAVGTLNVVARQKAAFTGAHVERLQPLAEMFAVTAVAQSLLAAATHQRTLRALAELTVGVATEINNALQTIVGHCQVLQREYPDVEFQRDIGAIVRQAQRISSLLERIRQASATSGGAGSRSGRQSL
jgi:transcriptional regulator with GAF, ATPase, and Fis domain